MNDEMDGLTASQRAIVEAMKARLPRNTRVTLSRTIPDIDMDHRQVVVFDVQEPRGPHRERCAILTQGGRAVEMFATADEFARWAGGGPRPACGRSTTPCRRSSRSCSRS